MNDTDQAIRIAELIKQLRNLYRLRSDTDNAVNTCQPISKTCSRQAINHCRAELGKAVWGLSTSYREHSKQILSHAFLLAQDTTVTQRQAPLQDY